MKPFLNLLLFNACWWIAVLSARWHVDALGIAAILACTAPLVRASPSPRAFVVFLAAATLLGFFVDSAMVATGVIRIRAGWQPVAWLCPPWLAAMWLNFAGTLDYSLAWTRKRPLAAAILGAVGGPLSYWGGERLGVISFGVPTEVALGILAAAWAATMVALPSMRARAEILLPEPPRGVDRPIPSEPPQRTGER